MEFFGCAGYGRGEAAARALFDGAIVLTPGLSFANLGQLTLDLLINSVLTHDEMQATLVGHLFSKHVLPLAGSPAFATQSTGLCLNLEVYLLTHPRPEQSKMHKIVFVQQRASVIPGHAAAFCNDLVAWAAASGASQVVVLSGADNMLRPDPSMHDQRIQWTATANADIANTAFLAHLAPLECTTTQDDLSVWASVRGAGLAPLVLTTAAPTSVAALAIVMYCAEGNNVPDAVYFASCVAQYLSFQTLPTFKLVVPPSWNQLFGRAPAMALYS
ncbi:Aste57867_20144 [Aphanomyces stellatus]|uniref:Proteasome assembly chaperone 2 n=1 Tax=Aphanomyces stellatus TaxID=120398 RepID=A0A485LEA9_9STRA|nr:hypothetical protein As57867_020078 [Aphanomyces stellatus]VFT96839.1 Aste57867_20144 [Aphanomyces stellatus]